MNGEELRTHRVKEIEEKIEERYFTRESFLHGHCFYDSTCESEEQIGTRIKKTNLYIEDAERLALKE